MITLTDDGTIDTVLRCDKCGEEFRFDYDPSNTPDDAVDPNLYYYEIFVEDCIKEIEEEHTCPEM